MISQKLYDFANAWAEGAETPVARSAISSGLRTQTIGEEPHIAVDLTASGGDGAALLADLEALGLQQGVAYKDAVSGLLPASAVGALADLPNLAIARPSEFVAHAGSVTTQSDKALYADLARADFGVDGSGVKIGIISDSFDTALFAATSYADDIASGDLPADVTILADGTQFVDSDEGRAMAQLVHDIAPGAEILFHSVGLGQASFAQAIDALVAAGADIIVDDVLNYAEPRYQDGLIAQAAQDAVDAGVAYFSAIGNQGAAGYTSAFVGGQYHDWDTGPGVDEGNDFTLPAGMTIILTLHWSDPYLTGTGGASSGAQSDLDLVTTREFFGLPVVFAESIDSNIGGDPVEVLTITNTGSQDIVLDLLVEHMAGPIPAEFSITGFGIPDGDFVTGLGMEHSDGFGTVSTYGHATGEDVIGVGAARFDLTPAFGITAGSAFPEAFTSLTGVTFLYDQNGAPLPAPITREDVDITASQRGNTTFLGDDVELTATYPDGDPDPDLFPNFAGTSAAAPNAAAVAALLLEASPNLTPAQIETILETTADDIDTPFSLLPPNNQFDQAFIDQISLGVGPGYDLRTGHGHVNAYSAIASVVSTEPVSLYADSSFTTLIAAYPSLPDALAAATDGSGILITNPDAVGNAGAQTITADNLTIRGDAPYEATFTLAPGVSSATLQGSGNANLIGNSASNTLAGSSGANDVAAGGGGDVVSGGPGDDTLLGAPGPDTLAGDAGADRLQGDGGEDDLSGGDGDDTLVGGTGGDTLTGGDGNDRLLGEMGKDSLDGGAGDDSLWGANANDTLIGGAGDDTLTGLGEADYLDGGAGADSLLGGASADTLLGGDGADFLDGGAFTDSLDGGAGSDTLLGGARSDTLRGGTEGDTLDGGSGGDRIFGDDGADLLRGGIGNDALQGGSGADTLEGGNANDTLDGGAGADSLDGGSGSDRLIVAGLEGGDTLTGGAGADTFVFATGFGMATITDFTGQDVIDLASVAAISGFGDLVISYGADAVVELSAGDALILLGVSSGLAVDDFIFA